MGEDSRPAERRQTVLGRVPTLVRARPRRHETSRATDSISQQVETIRTQTSEAVHSIEEIDSSMQALTSIQQSIDDLIQGTTRDR